MTRIVWNEAALQRLFRDEHGPIGRDLKRRAINVESAAKLNATGRQVEGAINPENRGPRVDTGRLRGSITHELRQEPRGLVARIGTNVEYGRFLEEGIPARDGTRTYPFLAPALPAAKL